MRANIIGLGLDATDIARIAATIERYGERFLHRIFTDGEIAYCMRRRDAGDSFRRPLRREGSGDEGARHRPLAAACCGATSKSSAAAVRRNCSCTAAPPGGSRRSAARSSLLTITHSDTLALAQVLLLGD